MMYRIIGNRVEELRGEIDVPRVRVLNCGEQKKGWVTVEYKDAGGM